MSTAALPGTYGVAENQLPQEGRLAAKASQPVRRRASLQQGFALETLGHAVEYLVDSRLFAQSEVERTSDQEAIQLLMRLSRAVFAECPEVVPLRQKLGRWVEGNWKRRGTALRSAEDRPLVS